MPDYPSITPIGADMDASIRACIDGKTKPPGSLGRLEEIAFQLARIQQRMTPVTDPACHLVFAADHGICEEGISPFPQAVTGQMVRNFLDGGAAISVFCRQQGVSMKVVNAGVASPLPQHPELIDAPVRAGSGVFCREAAMNHAELEQCLDTGARLVDEQAGSAAILSLGEMGIGNTTTAAALVAALLDWSPQACVGAGTGADAAMQAHKADVIRRALALHRPDPGRPLEVLRCLGGLEIAMMTGAFLRAGARGKAILVDGFIATAAWLVAARLEPALRDYSFFAHQSDERGHAAVLNHLDVHPILHLDMRLGEGTGALAALPLLRLAAAFFNEMASFEGAGVSAGP